MAVCRPSVLVLALALSGPVGGVEPLAGQGPDLAGRWAGALELPGARLRLVFDLTVTEAGIAATMDSPDQGVRGLSAGPVDVDGDQVTIAVSSVGGSFAGRLSGDTLRGEWRQGGQVLPLTLVRGGSVEEPPEPKRPQEPRPPFPYTVDEVRYPNTEAGVELAGTLTVPQGTGPFPAVVLVTGSGPQTRDEVVAGHRIFAVLADHLTRRGIAVLRFDDRGVGESTGDFAAATTVDFAGDAAAGVAFLRSRPEIDPARIGVVGHSEGGLVAPMVARDDPQLAFIVLLAGPAVDGEEILVSQTAAMQRLGGVPGSQIEANETAIRRVAGILTSLPRAVWTDSVRAALLDAVPAGVPEDQAHAAVDPQVASFATPWMAFFVGYDPRPALESLELDVLALNGSLDMQVIPALNLPVMRAALGDRAGTVVEELEGLNHLFQPARTGSPTEYRTIEITFDPGAMERIATWIREVGTAGEARNE